MTAGMSYASGPLILASISPNCFRCADGWTGTSKVRTSSLIPV